MPLFHSMIKLSVIPRYHNYIAVNYKEFRVIIQYIILYYTYRINYNTESCEIKVVGGCWIVISNHCRLLSADYSLVHDGLNYNMVMHKR